MHWYGSAVDSHQQPRSTGASISNFTNHFSGSSAIWTIGIPLTDQMNAEAGGENGRQPTSIFKYLILYHCKHCTYTGLLGSQLVLQDRGQYITLYSRKLHRRRNFASLKRAPWTDMSCSTPCNADFRFKAPVATLDDYAPHSQIRHKIKMWSSTRETRSQNIG